MADSTGLIAVGRRVQILGVGHHAFGVLRLGQGAGAGEVWAVGARLGLDLPQTPNRAVGSRPRLLWTAPLEWTVIDASAEQIMALRGLGADMLSHYADLTDARAGFRILGDDAARLLGAECPLDLDPAVMPEDRCAQSVFAGMSILLDRRATEDGLRLYVDISLAAHLNAWLIAAGKGLS